MKPSGLAGWTWCLALLLVASACAENVDTPQPEQVDTSSVAPAVHEGRGVVRGMLVLGPEVRSLKPCEEETELWVIPIEAVQQAYTELAGAPYDPVFVEVEAAREAAPSTGFGADYSGQLRLTALRRAAPANEGFGCAEDLSAVAFRAGGQEPFWHVRVQRDQVTLSTPEIPRTVFSAASPIPLDDGWRYESQSTGPETVRLRLDLHRGRCTDSMVGAVYSWTAILDVGGDVRIGCAWSGALAPGR